MLKQLTEPAPSAPPPRTPGRWAFPAVVGLGIVAGIAIAAVLINTSAADVSPPTPSVAVGEQSPVPLAQAPDLLVDAPAMTSRPAYLIIQDEIDKALAERDRANAAGG